MVKRKLHNYFTNKHKQLVTTWCTCSYCGWETTSKRSLQERFTEATILKILQYLTKTRCTVKKVKMCTDAHIKKIMCIDLRFLCKSTDDIKDSHTDSFAKPVINFPVFDLLKFFMLVKHIVYIPLTSECYTRRGEKKTHCQFIFSSQFHKLRNAKLRGTNNFLKMAKKVLGTMNFL